MESFSFTQLEHLALMSFNQCCEDLTKDYDKSLFGLLELRRDALEKFFVRNKLVLFRKQLLDALLKIRPHWRECVCNHPKCERIDDQLRLFFTRGTTRSDLLSSVVVASPTIWGFVTTGVPMPSRFVTRRKDEQIFCIVHKDRKVTYKKKNLCTSCYGKLSRLDLLDYPLTLDLLYVLKVRKKTREPVGYCVNHPKRLALGNKLCSECNRALGLLEQRLLDAGITLKSQSAALKRIF